MCQKSLLWTALVVVACGLDPQPVLPANGDASVAPDTAGLPEPPPQPGNPGQTPSEPTAPPGSAAGGTSGVDPGRMDEGDTEDPAGEAGAGGASGAEAEQNAGGWSPEPLGGAGGSGE
jgi:hypothetical protein